ncbi:MAG: hypothetical protein IKA70_05150 [Alistipes sp.]|nr:hypothetical protein [Alistipes sp.]
MALNGDFAIYHSRFSPKALAERLRPAKLGEAGEYSSYFPASPNERNAAIAA